MIDRLKPYPKYKDSGVEWLGKVPEHWEQVPGRSCFIEKQVSNVGMVEKIVLSLSFGRIVVKPEEKLTGLVPESFETYQVVDPGDIICRPTDLQNDHTSLRFGFSNNRGIITSAYMCLETQKQLDRRFGYLLLHAYDLKKVFYGLGSGLRQNLSWADFKYLPCALPPLSEQAAIMRFLDYVDRRIRRYIRAKQKLIKLLEEQKQAIIHRAVTRGLNPDVRLKDSGVEWLGDVPKHWEAVPLRYLGTKFGSGITPRGGATVYQDTGVPLLRSQNVHFSGLRLEGVARISPELHESLSATHVHPGDVLLNITGASLGRVCTAPHDFSQGNVNQHVCIIRTKQAKLAPEFLSAFLSTPGMQREIQVEQTGAAREGLTLNAIRSFMILLPPLSEQSAIIQNLNEATASIDSAIIRANREIKLLNEYRTRLIADVVTGKLDVREAAASLPDESQESAQPDHLQEES